MTFTRVILALACLMSGTLVAQEAKVTQLLSKDLTSLPGKEGLMITVEYPPGSSDPIHRHNAYGFIYVLEGSIVMQVRGGKESTTRRDPFRNLAYSARSTNSECASSAHRRRSGDQGERES